MNFVFEVGFVCLDVKRQGMTKTLKTSLVCALVCPRMSYMFLCVVLSLKSIGMNQKY